MGIMMVYQKLDYIITMYMKNLFEFLYPLLLFKASYEMKKKCL